VHFGFPLTIDRSHDDFYPLMVANSFLGEHRTLHGRLMQQLRGGEQETTAPEDGAELRRPDVE